MAESKEELNSLLMKVKEESKKAGLRLNIQKTNIMASSPITSWQINGGTVKTLACFIILGSKITMDVDYSHKIKICFPWKESYDKLSILSRNITFPTKAHIVKAMIFPVVI